MSSADGSAAVVDVVIREACKITDASASCYTASWYLIWDQVRYWLLFQAPIIAASVVYEWLELSSLPRFERLRAAFDSPLTRAAVRPASLFTSDWIIVLSAHTSLSLSYATQQNHLLQIVTCTYVCIAWSASPSRRHDRSQVS